MESNLRSMVMKVLDASTMPIETLLVVIKRLVAQGHTRLQIGKAFSVPVTGQRISQYLTLDRLSTTHRRELFRAIDGRQLGFDVAVKRLQGAHDANARRNAEIYLLNRVEQYRKAGKKISRGFNPVLGADDKRR